MAPINEFWTPRYYILRGKIPVAVDTSTKEGIIRWGKCFESEDRHVARETVCGFDVSTVFLGLDHQYDKGGPPLLFETMVFEQYQKPITRWGITIDRDETDLFPMRRYSTWEEAEAGHKEIVEEIRRSGLRVVNGG